MKYALINTKRSVAKRGAEGICPCCKSEMIARCGKKRIDHWAHKNKQECDHWWENETAWHRDWKNYFPEEWQEVIHKDEATGEKHIADIKTDEGWVIEVQHSAIDSEERTSRNNFYKKIVWIVDGTRLKRDSKKFGNMFHHGIQFQSKAPTYAINPEYQCNLVKDWHDENAFVFFDFQQVNKDGQPIIWLLFPRKISSDIILSHFPKKEFILMHHQNIFNNFFAKDIPEIQMERSRLLDVYRKSKRIHF